MKTLIQLLIDAVCVADKSRYKGKIIVSPAFFDIDNYEGKQKMTGDLIRTGCFGGYELQIDSSLQGYGITLNTNEQ
jgi:hypothetical protein